MPKKELEELLTKDSGKRLNLTINDNQSTMLSVRWESDHTCVSLHRMFLRAPKNVMESLACYIKGDSREITPTIKAFIDQNLQKLDYSHRVDPDSLVQQGECYDLQSIYESVNLQYFKSALDLRVTWYGKQKKLYRSSVNLGLYHDILRLVKVHRTLDSYETPEEVIEFVIYHEMLHAVCPVTIDNTGRRGIHTEEFRKREKEFDHYLTVKEWINKNKKQFFI